MKGRKVQEDKEGDDGTGKVSRKYTDSRCVK